MPINADMIALAETTIASIKPLLAGKDPQVQGMVVAELTAMFIGGHHPDTRADIWDIQKRLVESLIALHAPPDHRFRRD